MSKLSASQKDRIRKVIIQIAQFIEGGTEAVEPDAEFPLWRFNNDEKAIIERGINRITDIADEEGKP